MLRFRDRVGIVADISVRIAGLGMNIASMEVQRLNDEAQSIWRLKIPAIPTDTGD